jgi:hypothetical protein
MAMDPHNFDIHPGSGHTIYQAKTLAMPDYHDFVNSATGGVPVPGIVSFRVEWAPSKDKHRYHYAPNRWEGKFLQTEATCVWSGRTELAEFSTDTNNPTIFAEVGFERNGVFFSENPKSDL